MPELVVIGIIALLILGPKRLPEAGRGVSRAIREFKQGITGQDGRAESMHGVAARSESHDFERTSEPAG